MKTRKRTFFRNLLAMAIRNQCWMSNPKNLDKIIAMEQFRYQAGFTYMICFLFFAVSCKPVQQITKIKTDSIASVSTQLKTNTEQTQTTNVQEKSVITAQIDSSTSNINFNTDKSVMSGTLVVYDTSKPVNERTGKPPIKSELNWSNKKDIERKSVEASNFSNQENKKTDVSAEQKKASNNDTKIKSKSNNEIKTDITEEWFANKSLILFVLIGIGIVIYFIVSKTTPIGILTKIIRFFRKK